jgi:hypothetical protein
MDFYTKSAFKLKPLCASRGAVFWSKSERFAVFSVFIIFTMMA